MERPFTPGVSAFDVKIIQNSIDDLVKMVDQNDPTGKIKIGRVKRIFHNDPQPLWILRFDELELGVTKEHPFFVYGKGWVQAEHLEIGDVCRSAADTEIVLTSKEFDAEPVSVYNFEVEDGHTYFVGETKEESVLVHNTCPQCGGDGKYIGTRNNNILDRSFYFITTGGRSLSKQQPIWNKCPCVLPNRTPSGSSSPGDVFRNLPHEAGNQFFDENSIMSLALLDHPAIKTKASELAKALGNNPGGDHDGPNFDADPAVESGQNGEADWILYSVHSGEFSHGDQWGFARLAEDLFSYGMITYLKTDKHGVWVAGTPYGGTTLPPQKIHP